MREQLISFETAKLTKKTDFDIKCDYIYGRCFPNLDFNHLFLNNSTCPADFYCYAPTQSLLQKWLREKHGIHILIIPTITSDWTYKTITVISERDNDVIKGIKSVSDLPPYDNVCGYDFNSYEDALEAGLQETLKLITK